MRSLESRKRQGETRKKKDYAPWNKGLTKETDERVKKHSLNETYRKKMSLINIGRNDPKKGMTNEEYYGKEKAEEIKQKLRQVYLNNSEKIIMCQKKLWANEEYKNQTLLKQRQGLILKPNKVERRLIEIMKNNNLSFDFVGDWKIVIGGRCPDFINSKDKKIILLHGDYWHYSRFQKKNPKLTKEEIEKKDINHYKKHNFDCMIIWENEIVGKKRLEEPILINKINMFRDKTHKLEVIQNVC